MNLIENQKKLLKFCIIQVEYKPQFIDKNNHYLIPPNCSQAHYYLKIDMAIKAIVDKAEVMAIVS